MSQINMIKDPEIEDFPITTTLFYRVANGDQKRFEEGVRLLEVALNHLPKTHFQHGSWDCEDSPTGKCVYTQYAFDDCIFCGGPDERK